MLNFKSFFLFFLLFFNLLHANDVAYDFALSNKNPYEKEAIVLEVNLTQLNHEKVMLFKFSLKHSDDYEFHQIGFKEHEKYHDLRQEYAYLIYPKKSGQVFLEFQMTKSITDDDKVAYSISGDRDNVKGLQKEDIVEKLKPLSLEVKALPKGVEFVGDFTLSHKIDRTKTEAYDPVNLKVLLKGKGYLSSFKLLKNSPNYKLFSQNPKFKIIHSKEGSSSSIEWDYAISAKESFSLKQKFLKAFNPKTQKVYDLTLPSYNIEVEKVEAKTLLDEVDSPARAKGIDWDFWFNIFSYMVVFMAGWLMPRYLFKRKNIVSRSAEELLHEKIKKAKTHKALLKILLLENRKIFAKAIEALEGVVYNGEKISLEEIKNSIKEERA